MKKFLATLLALVMVFSCAACFAEAVDPETIPDEFESENGVFELAFVTDVGQLKDKSFNQGTWNGVKSYAAANGLSYKYYQPANGDQATDDDRYEAMKAACEGGAKVVVCAGFMQAAALEKAATEYPDTKFVFIDGWQMGLKNVAPIAFMEEQSGYLAGYAIVKEGFTKLGFMGGGGGTNPACCRYGYGFAQGANAAAAELGINVELKYSWQYGASFGASPELEAMAKGWYMNGTEVIFACGGSMFSSIVSAASANDLFVIGVDVDQSFESETVVTSALKGLVSATEWAIGKFYAGEWDSIGDVANNLGATDNAVGLPTATWSLENWTVAEYEALLASIVDGSLVIDNTVLEADAITGAGLANLTVIYEYSSYISALPFGRAFFCAHNWMACSVLCRTKRSGCTDWLWMNGWFCMHPT
ncbi:MAG: BMP family ABC transporter substrate-binding protein [Clostridia bacterium]|nr:BMP family ABC transporter substrate-binding protein [Clostridia bacterium]